MLKELLSAIAGWTQGDQLFAVYLRDFPIYPFSWFVEELKLRLVGSGGLAND